MTGDTGKKRWMPLVLGLSLAINLAVVAAVAGAAWRHKGEDPRAMRTGKGGPVFIQALPQEARQALRAQLRSGASRPGVDVTQMVAALRQEPFDPDAMVQAIEGEIEAGAKRMRDVRQAWLDQVGAMDAQAREAYALRLEELAEQRKARLEKRRSAD